MPIHAPYPVGSLHPPLTATQKTTALAYMVASGTSAADIQKSITDTIGFQGSVLFGSLAKYVATNSNARSAQDVDPIFIGDYDAIAGGGGINVHPKIDTTFSPPGFGTLKDLLGFLGNPVRLGELVVGVVMVGVAFAAVLKRGNK